MPAAGSRPVSCLMSAPATNALSPAPVTHHAAHAVVVPQLEHGAPELVDGRGVERVADVGPVDGDRADRAVAVQEQVVRGHGGPEMQNAQCTMQKPAERRVNAPDANLRRRRPLDWGDYTPQPEQGRAGRGTDAVRRQVHQIELAVRNEELVRLVCETVHGAGHRRRRDRPRREGPAHAPGDGPCNEEPQTAVKQQVRRSCRENPRGRSGSVRRQTTAGRCARQYSRNGPPEGNRSGRRAARTRGEWSNGGITGGNRLPGEGVHQPAEHEGGGHETGKGQGAEPDLIARPVLEQYGEHHRDEKRKQRHVQ